MPIELCNTSPGSTNGDEQDEEQRIPLERADKLPAEDRVKLGLEFVQRGRQSYYVNVKNADAFLVTIIYSRASIIFITIIGLISAANFFLFRSQLSNAENLCQLHKLLPPMESRNAKPVQYYCRFLQLSIFANVLQALLCLFAIVSAIKRRSNFFLICYVLLFIVLIGATAAIGSLFVVDYHAHLRQSIQFSLIDSVSLAGNGTAICRQMPSLRCVGQSTATNSACETNKWDESVLSWCADELSAPLMAKYQLLALFIEYFLLISAGFAATTKSMSSRRRRLRQLTAAANTPPTEEKGEANGVLNEQRTPSSVENGLAPQSNN